MKLFVAIGILAIVFSIIPNLVGVFRAGPDYVPLSLNALGPSDTNIYFSMMKQAAEGEVLLRNLHTSEPQFGSLFFPLWLVLGWIAALFSLSMPFVFHLARVVFGALFLFLLADTIRRSFVSHRLRVLAYALVVFGSGIGWVFAPTVDTKVDTNIFYLLPIDQWVSESNTMLTLLHSPLFILSQMLLFLFFRAWLFPYRHSGLVSVALLALLALVHPYDVVTALSVVAAWLLVRMVRDSTITRAEVKKGIGILALCFFLALLVYLQFQLISKTEFAIGAWAKQNITTSPPPHSYIIGFGGLLIFAIVGAVRMRRTTNPVFLFFFVWLVVSLLLLYLPVPAPINRRWTNAIQIPMAFLAAYALDGILVRVFRLQLRSMARHAVLSILAWSLGIVLGLGTLVAVVRGIYWQWTPETSPLFFLPKSMDRAMAWLDENADKNDIVLSYTYTGNIIPAKTGLRVYVGHGHQTIRWYEKRARVNDWFLRTNSDDAEKERFLKEEGITHLFYGPYERRLGSFQPDEKSYLVSVYQGGDVTIYRVR